jgi:PAS domain S-box-containing protein
MQDWEKSREQLIDELKEMRLKVYKLDNAQINVDNITEQQHALNELRNIQENYRELVEYTNSIIVRWDIEGKITFLNKFGQTFFGYSAEEILGRNAIGTIVSETDQAGRNLQQMIRDISVYPERYEKNQNENMRRNGERVWISWTNMPIFDEHGNVREVVSIGNDHTDLRLAEEELRKSKEDLETRVIERTAKLRESEEKYRLLFESAPIGITLDNREGEVLEVNRAV